MDYKRKATNGKTIVSVAVILLLLALAAPVAAIGYLIDQPGECAIINDGVFCNATVEGATGSGVWGPFLRVDPTGSSDIEYGFNNNKPAVADPTNPMVTYSGGQDTFTHALLLSTIPTVEYNGTLYRRVDLDANNNDKEISIDKVKVYWTTRSDTNIHDYDYCADTFNSISYSSHLIYTENTGCGADEWKDYIDLKHGTGSGKSDMSLFIPAVDFPPDGGSCDYGGQTCDVVIVLYFYGGYHQAQGSGFEEWAIMYYPIVSVEKTAVGSEGITYDWTIDKEANGTYAGFTGDSWVHDYKVTVNRTQTTANRKVIGNITITNPATFQDGKETVDAVISSITDAIGALTATVSCPDDTVPSDSTMTCSYQVINSSLPGSGTNEVEVTLEDSPLLFGDTAPFTISQTVNGYPQISVTDTNGESWGPVSANTTWSYTKTFECDSDEGKHDNTATIVETGEADSASVTVNCYALDVTKDAATTSTRNCTWELDKSVDVNSWPLFTGDSGISEFTLAPSVDCEDSAWAVTGNISVHNPAPIAAPITNVADVVSPAISADITCGVTFPYSLAAGGDLECTYSAGLPNATARTNTATATLQNYAHDPPSAPTPDGTTSWSGTADVIFGDPTTILHGCVVLDDTNEGFTDPELCYGDAPFDPISYNVTYTCDGDEGSHQNTATLKDAVTDALLDSDSETVAVDCYALDVTKDASTSSILNCTWGLNKSVDVNSWPLFTGDSGISNFTLTPSVNCVGSDREVSGVISVYNPAPIDAIINSVSDVVSPAISADVECGVSFPYSLVADDTLGCSYSADLPDTTNRTNTATATLQNYIYDPPSAPTENGTTDFSGSANVTFGDPTTIVHKCVVLDDLDYVDEFDEVDPGQLCFDDVLTPVSYDVKFTCDGDAGDHPNTATMRDADTDDLLDSDAENVHVACSVASGAEKNATTSYTRTWNWTINKLADQTNLTLSVNQTFLVNYNVTVDASSTDSDWAASGFITIVNNLNRVLDVSSVTDEVDSVTATVDCGSDTTIDALESLVCSYNADLSGTTNLTNTANISASYNTVTCSWDGDEVVCAEDGGSEEVSHLPTAEVLFNGPTSIVDECIDLTDSQYGDLGTVCANEVPKTFNYSILIGPYGLCGDYTFDNCASFETNDTGATGEDCWSVLPTIPCPEGCTLTQGYWKTHSIYGPAAHPDDTWYLLPGGLGPDTLFFQLKLGGVNQTWYNVFWTNPKGGNAYYILAHQYEAAVLNSLAGADVPPNVATAISQAAVLLEQYDGTPNSFDGLKGKNAAAVRTDFLRLAGILGDYNEGKIGPGHCDEDSTSAPS